MAKSPFYVPSKPLTRADELRDQLNELEARVGRLGYGLGQEALTIPALFDAVSAGLASFQAEGQAMRAEEARLTTVSADLRRKARLLLREIGGVAPLRAARNARQPDPGHWWWFLDEWVAAKRRAQLRGLLWVAAGLVAVLLLLFAVYQLFLAPDPATRERLRRQQAAESLAVEGNLAGALSEVEEALTIAPGDPSLLTLKGTLQQGLGQSQRAEETFSAAEAAFGEREVFLLARGQAYLIANQAQAALADAQALLVLNPQSAPGYMLLGRAQEWLENYPEAIAAYQQAATLAEAQGDFQLTGLARVNMGMLMQRMRAQ
jgi:tetratricopeptide (TPR) repeat protein